MHLHVHSEYSIRDALIRINELVEFSFEKKWDAIALTDHGNLSGVLEFYLEAKEKNIKPIIGMEAYIIRNTRIKEKEKRYHLTLLAKNECGYKNLVRLASFAGTIGFYYVPCLDLRTIAKYRSGIIAMTACSMSSVLYLAGEGGEKKMTVLLKNIFADDLFLEIMPHDFEEQRRHNFLVLGLSEDLGVSLVVTQDAHYLRAEDKEVHDILMKIQDREPYEVDTLFLGAKEYLVEEFTKNHQYISSDDVLKAIEMTDTIAKGIEEYNIPIGVFEFPIFHL